MFASSELVDVWWMRCGHLVVWGGCSRDGVCWWCVVDELFVLVDALHVLVVCGVRCVVCGRVVCAGGVVDELCVLVVCGG